MLLIDLIHKVISHNGQYFIAGKLPSNLAYATYDMYLPLVFHFLKSKTLDEIHLIDNYIR